MGGGENSSPLPDVVVGAAHCSATFSINHPRFYIAGRTEASLEFATWSLHVAFLLQLDYGGEVLYSIIIMRETKNFL